MSQRGSVFQLSTSVPSVVAGIAAIETEPTQYRYLIERHLVRAVERRGVGQRTSEVGKTGLHRVFPSIIGIGIQIFVDDRIRFLNLCMSSRGVLHRQRFEDVPTQGELTVPKELFREGKRQLHVEVEVALLILIIVTRDVAVE